MKTEVITYNDIKFNYTYNEDDKSGEDCIIEIVNIDAYKLYKYKNLTGYILDIGGNHGVVSIILALQNPQAKIITLEPISSLCNIIRHNLETNNIKNVTLVNKALGDGNDTKITIGNSCSGASSTIVTNDSLFGSIQKGVKNIIEDIKTITFDSLLNEYNINTIELLKIDCEGGEFYLYDSNKIKENIINHLVGEFHDFCYNKQNSNWNSNSLTAYLKKYIHGDFNVTYNKK